MSLPKTLSPKLIKELNEACDTFRRIQCENECDDVGWCDACWIMVGGGGEVSSTVEQGTHNPLAAGFEPAARTK